MSDRGYTPARPVARTRRALAARGVRPVIGDLARWACGAVAGLPWTLTGSRGAFELQGRSYGYLYARHKLTWLTERAVEVPVVKAIIDRYAGKRVLEVGNVLAYYQAGGHLVVDKYEFAPGVLNRDVLDLDDLGPFDLIVAISTLEHVGWDEHPRDPHKALRAADALRSLLAPGGELVATVPAGYHPFLDDALRTGQIPSASLSALRRYPGQALWREVTPDEAWGASYDFLLYRAWAVVFAVIQSE